MVRHSRVRLQLKCTFLSFMYGNLILIMQFRESSGFEIKDDFYLLVVFEMFNFSKIFLKLLWSKNDLKLPFIRRIKKQSSNYHFYPQSDEGIGQECSLNFFFTFRPETNIGYIDCNFSTFMDMSM